MQLHISRAPRISTLRAYTLIEAIIVLAIAGLLIAGVWLYSTSSINAAKKNKLAEQAVQILTNTRNILQNAPSATGLTLTAAITAGIIPPDMARSTTTAAHAFNGAVNLTVNGTDTNLVDLTLAQVPGDACIDLISGRIAATAEAADQFGISAIQIGTATAITVFPSAEDVSTNCGNDIADIIITFSAS